MNDSQVKMVDNIVTDTDPETQVSNSPLSAQPDVTRVLRDGRVMLRVVRGGQVHYISISGQTMFVE